MKLAFQVEKKSLYKTQHDEAMLMISRLGDITNIVKTQNVFIKESKKKRRYMKNSLTAFKMTLKTSGKCKTP